MSFGFNKRFGWITRGVKGIFPPLVNSILAWYYDNTGDELTDKHTNIVPPAEVTDVNALYLDGSTAHVELSKDIVLTGDFSFSVLLKGAIGGSANHGLLANGTGSNFLLTKISGVENQMSIRLGTGTIYTLPAAAPFNLYDGEWHILTVSRSGIVITYHDSVSDLSDTINTETGDFTLKGFGAQNIDIPSNWFMGTLSTVDFVDAGLYPLQEGHGLPMDRSGNGNHVIENTATWQIPSEELVDNGTFDDGTGWTLGINATISGGFLNLFESGDSAQYTIPNMVNGRMYTLEYEVLAFRSTGGLFISGNSFAASTLIPNTVGKNSVDLLCEDNTKPLFFMIQNTTTLDIDIDNVSIKSHGAEGIPSANLENGFGENVETLQDTEMVDPSVWDYDPAKWTVGGGQLECTDGVGSPAMEQIIFPDIALRNGNTYRLTITYAGTGSLFISSIGFGQVSMNIGASGNDLVVDIPCLGDHLPFRLASSGWLGVVTSLKLEQLDVLVPAFPELMRSVATFDGVDYVSPPASTKDNCDYARDFVIGGTFNFKEAGALQFLWGSAMSSVNRCVVSLESTGKMIFGHYTGSHVWNRLDVGLTAGEVIDWRWEYGANNSYSKLFINEVEVSTSILTSTTTSPSTFATIGALQGGASPFNGIMSSFYLEGAFSYNMDDGSGLVLADSSGNGNDGTITATSVSDFWKAYVAEGGDRSIDVLGNELTNVGGTVSNGFEGKFVMSDISIIDTITIIGGLECVVPYFGVFADRGHWTGDCDLVYNGQWEAQAGSGETWTHATATGVFPPRTGWSIGSLGAAPLELVYDSFAVDDTDNEDIQFKQWSHQDLVDFVILNGDTLIQWEKLGVNDFCHVVAQIFYEQGTVEGFTFANYVKALDFIGDTDCGSGIIEPLRDVNEDILYDDDGEIIFVQPS